MSDERAATSCCRLADSNWLLHLMANRGDVDAVDYLVRHGANVGALYAHWDYEVTEMQLAILANHPGDVSVLPWCSSAVDDCNEMVKHILVT